MMRLLFLFIVFVGVTAFAKGQCINPEFSILNADKLCRYSPIQLVNESDEALSYYWDLCPETFTETPQSETSTFAGLAQGYGYRLVEDNGQWYGFLVSRSLDRLFRLDFGSDPQNVPQAHDLGNPGGLMDAPEAIDLIQDNQKWYAFVGKGENSSGQIVKFEFGSDLTSVPNATGYGTFGAGSVRIRDLSVIRQGDDIILLLLQYNNSSVNRINFGNSLENAPGASNVIAIPGATLTRSFDLIHDIDGLRAHVACENGLLIQVSFGNDITGPLTVEGNFNFTSVIQPWKIRTIANGGKYFAFISNNNRKYSIIDFGDLSLNTTPTEIVNGNDERFIGIDVVKYNGKTLLQGGTSGSTLISVAYHSDCGLPQDFSYQDQPAPFSYSVAGSRRIDLFAFGNPGEYCYASKNIEIIDTDAPIVSISYEGICQGNDVAFSAPGSADISSWSWDFGNASTSGSPSPTASYATPGTYTVMLEAEAANGCFTGDQREIKIYPPPVADFTMPSGLICSNNEFIFSSAAPDEYDGYLSYQWSVDNVDVGIQQDLHYTFSTTGSKSITLQTSIPGCSDEVTKTTSAVQPGPAVDFSFTGTCEDDVFVFQHDVSGPVESYGWNFGDGNTAAAPDASNQFPAFGEYPVSLTATNALGCQNVKTKTVAVSAKPLVDFSVEGPPNACAGTPTLFRDETVTPDDAEMTEWLWDFGDPQNNNAQDRQNPEHAFENPGTYTVALTATSAMGCAESVEKAVVIAPSPSTDFTFTPACEDVPAQFTSADNTAMIWYWEIGTSYYVTQAPTHTFQAPGDYPLYLELTSANGCVSRLTRTIHVPAPLQPDFSVVGNCADNEAVFLDVTTGVDPVATRRWYVDGTEMGTGQSMVHTFPAVGSQPVTLHVTTTSGCAYAVSKPVVIVQPPVASFSATPSTGAWPLVVDLENTSSGATRYAWQFLDGSAASTEISPMHTFHDEGSFNVVLTASNEQECSDVYTKTITTVAPLPDADVEIISTAPNPDGSLKLVVTIQNKGNTVLKNVPIDIDFSGNLTLRQTLEGPVAPGAKENVVLSTGILDADALRYLCVHLNVENDLFPAGNRICKPFESTMLVFPSHPNPAASALNLEWISPAESTVHLVLTDALGRKIFNADVMSMQGLNRQTLDVSGLQPGLYYLTLQDGDSKFNQRIFVSDGP